MKASVKKMKLYIPKTKLISFNEGLLRTINWQRKKAELNKIFQIYKYLDIK